MEAINQTGIAAAPRQREVRPGGLFFAHVRQAALRIKRRPLFQKVIIANTVLIGVSSPLGVYLHQKYFADVDPSFLFFFVANTVLLAIIMNYLVVKMAFRPLDELTETVRAIRQGHRNIRVPQNSDDTQIEELSRSLNIMLNSMERQRKRGAASVIKAQEEERKRIARELHDETSQSLTGLVLSLRTVENLMPDYLPEIKERLDNINELAHTTLNEVHTMAVRLRPSVLDDLGLSAALRSHVKEFSQNTGIYVDLQIKLRADRLQPELETVFYRVVQEALTNVARHSGASSCQIKAFQGEGKVEVSIADNGCGFDPEKVLASEKTNRGLGLHGMKERIELVGGSLVFDSSPNQGSIIQMEVPTDAEEGIS